MEVNQLIKLRSFQVFRTVVLGSQIAIENTKVHLGVRFQLQRLLQKLD